VIVSAQLCDDSCSILTYINVYISQLRASPVDLVHPCLASLSFFFDVFKLRGVWKYNLLFTLFLPEWTPRHCTYLSVWMCTQLNSTNVLFCPYVAFSCIYITFSLSLSLFLQLCCALKWFVLVMPIFSVYMYSWVIFRVMSEFVSGLYVTDKMTVNYLLFFGSFSLF
jgi:hypothetical protein